MWVQHAELMGEESALFKPSSLETGPQNTEWYLHPLCVWAHISLTQTQVFPSPLLPGLLCKAQPSFAPEARFYRRLSIFGLNIEFVIYRKIKQYKDKSYKM